MKKTLQSIAFGTSLIMTPPAGGIEYGNNRPAINHSSNHYTIPSTQEYHSGDVSWPAVIAGVGIGIVAGAAATYSLVTRKRNHSSERS